ncbi:hypothetical protein KBB96_04345 [Luteolibacter ambystomatis]|uniref:DUF6916 domain-containing protein n=1 Tax=Luteolibacter ambystomatis TaxID=2824561 RepID=A0A975J180_9BACT|nr:hypothetical protein [Luteolibacter ambystomatis]QUE52124.1 hypothetical protein KBB96_04345 [Luteolibacter ambystomatis]
MNAPKSTDSPTPAFKRRHVLMVLAAGTCATAVGLKRIFTSPEMAFVPAPAAGGNKTTAPRVSNAAETPVEESPFASAPNVPDRLSRDWFLPHLNSRFSMSLTGSSTVDMTLSEVSAETRIHNDANAYTAFTILFDAPKGSPAAEGIYHIRHPQLGEMDLFLAPVGNTIARLQYEAAFTRKA